MALLIPPTRRIQLKLQVVFGAIGVVVIACVAYAAWDVHERTNEIEGVDALTGAVLPIECELDPGVDDGLPGESDLFANWNFGPEYTRDSQLNYARWRFQWNTPLSLIVSSNGYEQAKVRLSDLSSEIVIVSLHKKG